MTGCATPTIGHALRDIDKPVEISSYVTRLVETLPEELQSSLSTVADLEAELEEYMPLFY